MIEKLTKTNTRGTVGNKSNKSSSIRMDLSCLLQIRLSLENNNDSFVTLLILLFPYGFLYFSKYFAKYSLLFLFTFNRLKRDQITI